MSGITPDLPAFAAEIPGVLGKLEAARREFAGYRIWLWLASLLLWELALAGGMILADWMWVLPVAVRGLGLAAMAGLVVISLLRSRRQYGHDQAAVEVEALFPELGQRVRTVVEYAAPSAESFPASPGLLAALGRDTDRRTAGLDFRKLVPWAAFERRAVALFLAAAAGIIVLFASPGLRTAALRMLLIPVHFTTLAVEPGDVTLKAGDELKVKVALSGRPVSSAQFLYRERKRGSKWVSAPLGTGLGTEKPARPLNGTFTTGLKDCQADLDYRVVAGELESRDFHVKVMRPLLLKGVEAAITPPAYTRRPAEVVKAGRFKAIEGSRVQIAITLNHPPKNASLSIRSARATSAQTVALDIDGTKLTGVLSPITEDLEYHIDAVDQDGMKLEADSFRIKVSLDLEPTIRFIQPEESLGVTPIAEVPIEVEAGDDFGVSRVGINFKIGNGPEETLHLADYKDLPVTANALAMLYLEKHQIDYRDGISYYAVVTDNYPNKPHRVVSDLRFIDIFPFKHEYKLLELDGSSSSSLTLEELIARQRVNLNRTFVLERDRSIDNAAAMRLATFEEELATATAEFAEGLRAIGNPIPALDDALSAMRSATLSLDKQEVQPARSHEETALKWLIAARRNVAKVLSESRSKGEEGRKFDREQVQKIRSPHKDESKELAEFVDDLEELAEREEAFSEEIEAKGGGGPKLDPPPPNEGQAGASEQPASTPSESEQPGSTPSTKGSGSSKGQGSKKGEPPKGNPVQEQRKAAAEAERLRRLAQKDKALTESARRRLDAAARMVEESSKAMEAGRSSEAADKARDAARKLESVAREAGALKARELADALARQRDLAQAIAKAEKELGDSLERESKQSEKAGAGSADARAGRQRELAEDLAALQDVLERLRSRAALEHRELAQLIEQAARRNAPGEIKDSMRRNAEAIESGRAAEAAREARGLAEKVAELARDLESVRKAAAQPGLERLLEAEKQAARLLDRLRSTGRPLQRAQAEKGMTELAELVERLSPGDGPLRKAAANLRSAIRSNHTGVLNDAEGNQHGPGGLRSPMSGYNDSVGAVVLALQTRIQEIMFDNELADRDGPVPTRYKEMVENYYRVLSQDLR